METFFNFLKGMVIGIANIIPGVSGGTMAVVLDIYDNLISSISDFLKDWKKNLRFLLPIVLGAGSGILLFSKLLKNLLDNYPIPTSFFFIGLIVGSIPLIAKKANETKFKKVNLIPFFITFIFLVSLSIIAPPEMNETIIRELSVGAFIKLTLAGAIGAGAMIMPGISGSFILLLIGLYTTTITAVAEFNVPILIPIGIGVLLGLVFITKLIDKLLKKYPGPTYFGILGLVIGSIFSIYKGITFDLQGIISIVVLILGMLLAYFLGGEKKK